MTSKTSAHSNIAPQTLWYLLGCQIASLSVVAVELTWWMLAIIGLCLCWRALMNVQQGSKPSKGVLVLFSIAGCIILAVSARQLGLLLSMVHLLAFAYVLKSLELATRKDVYQLSLLGIFIIATGLIFLQSVYFSIAVLILVMMNFMLLHCLHVPEFVIKKPKKQLRLIAVLTLQALPLAVILFVVFPKLPPLWKVPVVQSGKSGLSDSVRIGDISQLAMSDELAFRVDFQTLRPQYSQLYWRAIVLEDFDGKQWTSKKPLKRNNRFVQRNMAFDNIRSNDKWLNYRVYAQPSFQPWLFALDVAAVSDSNIVQLPNFQLYSTEPLTKVKQYQVRSNTSMLLFDENSQQILAKNLAIPKQSNPLLTQEGERLRATLNTNDKIIEAVLKRFHQQNYVYTLSPPQLNQNSLDQFYFQTQAGFCEYYASSFAYLMRAAGIPARVVLGYMGGEYNPNGNYYSVYQRDAHAWTEVWLGNKGWQRVDPTAAVNPERVESGFNDSLLAEQAGLSNSFFTAKTFENVAWLNHLRLQLSALDYQWTRWVVGYSSDQQKNMLTRFFGELKLWKTALVIGSSLVFMMLSLWLIRFINQGENSAKYRQHIRLFKQVETQLAKLAVVRKKGLSVRQYQQQVIAQYPSLSSSISAISDYVCQLEYQALSKEQYRELTLRLKQEVKRFKRQVRQL